MRNILWNGNLNCFGKSWIDKILFLIYNAINANSVDDVIIITFIDIRRHCKWSHVKIKFKLFKPCLLNPAICKNLQNLKTKDFWELGKFYNSFCFLNYWLNRFFLKLILVCIVRDFHKNRCGLESWKNEFYSNFYFYVYILFKKPNKFIKNEKMKGSETLHAKNKTCSNKIL